MSWVIHALFSVLMLVLGLSGLTITVSPPFFIGWGVTGIIISLAVAIVHITSRG